MKRRNTVAIAAVLVVLLALAAAIYFLRPAPSSQPSTAQAPEASESPAPATPTPPAETTPAETAPDAEEKAAETPAATEEKTAETPAPAGEEAEQKTAEEPAASEDKVEDMSASTEQTAGDEPAAAEDEKTADATSEPEAAVPQPSFDVVRIEPTGEGVIAGRAAPGWKVIVESRGETVAEASADDQGEWTVVFDRPLSPGTHDLSVKATSPDGSKQFSSTQSVSADVAEPPTRKASLPEAETARLSDAAPAAVPPASPSVTPGSATSGSAPSLPQTAAIQEGKATPPSSLPPQTKPGNYTILPGDTLWDIATRYLGAGWRYKQIYKDNRQIIRNPNLIYPEQKMTIAEPPSEAN